MQVLERREDVRGTPVHVEDVSDVTNQANAYSSGFGPSANVVLWNTLLDGRFSPGEVKVVVAHEFGHVAHRHVLKGIGWTALVLVPHLVARHGHHAASRRHRESRSAARSRCSR